MVAGAFLGDFVDCVLGYVKKKKSQEIDPYVHVTTVPPPGNNNPLQPADTAPPEEMDTAHSAGKWMEICKRVVGQELSIWNTFLCPLLLSRAKVT